MSARQLFGLAAFCIVTLANPTAFGEDGVTKSTIRIGMITSFSGPVGSTGKQIRDGYAAAFKHVNLEGGIFGRKFVLDVHDDSYDPAKTVRETSRVVRDHDAFVLVGSNGTSTVATALPIVLQDGIPLLFPRSGLPSLRLFHENIFNFRPSFDDEIGSLIRYSLQRGRSRIAILFQTDAFGDALRGAALRITESLKNSRPAVPIVVSVSGIDRETTDDKYIEANFSRIEKGDPQTVILATSLAASAPFIKLASERQKSWLFLSVSSTNNLAEKLGAVETDLVFSQVVPDPFDSAGPAMVATYQADMRTIGAADFGFTSLEAYINGRILIEAVKRCGSQLTREKFIDMLEEHPFAIGGLEFDWSSTDHNGHAPVYLSQYARGKFLPVFLKAARY